MFTFVKKGSSPCGVVNKHAYESMNHFVSLQIDTHGIIVNP